MRRYTYLGVRSYCDVTKWPRYQRRSDGAEVVAIEAVTPFVDERERVTLDGYMELRDGDLVGVARESFELEHVRLS